MSLYYNGQRLDRPYINGVRHNAWFGGSRIWPGPPVYDGERFEITVSMPAAGTFYLPLAGYKGSDPNTRADYDWTVDWGDGNVSAHDGTGSDDSCIGHAYMAAGVYHVVIIGINNFETPVGMLPNPGWMRAWSFLPVTDGSAHVSSNKMRIISFDYVTDWAFADPDGTSYGYGHKMRLCTGTAITKPATEFVSGLLPDNIAAVSDNYRFEQYRACLSLQSGVDEIGWLPDSITTIGAGFLKHIYYGCRAMTTPGREWLPDGVTSVGNEFRYGQYWKCSSLLAPAAEILPASCTSAGTDFRRLGYAECSALLRPTAEVQPGLSTTGKSFRRSQYSWCRNLSMAGFVHSHQFPQKLAQYYQFFYLRDQDARAAADELPRYWLDAEHTASAPVTDLMPMVDLEYMTNRTGVPGYNGLHQYWV